MEITALKREYILKTGQKTSRSEFVGSTSQNNQKRYNPVLNEAYTRFILMLNSKLLRSCLIFMICYLI